MCDNSTMSVVAVTGAVAIDRVVAPLISHAGPVQALYRPLSSYLHLSQLQAWFFLPPSLISSPTLNAILFPCAAKSRPSPRL
jgi:hypothetical protein